MTVGTPVEGAVPGGGTPPPEDDYFLYTDEWSPTFHFQTNTPVFLAYDVKNLRVYEEDVVTDTEFAEVRTNLKKRRGTFCRGLFFTKGHLADCGDRIVDISDLALVSIERGLSPTPLGSLEDGFFVDGQHVPEGVVGVINKAYQACRAKRDVHLTENMKKACEAMTCPFRPKYVDGVVAAMDIPREDVRPLWDEVPAAVKDAAFTVLAYTVAASYRFQLAKAGFQIFPYLIVVGERGWGKTTLANIASDISPEDPLKEETRNFVSGNALNSVFRFSKYTATKVVPLVVEEFGDIGSSKELLDFMKTSTTTVVGYTSRGRADLSLVPYPSVRGLIVTCNNITIGDSALLSRCFIMTVPKRTKSPYTTPQAKRLGRAVMRAVFEKLGGAPGDGSVVYERVSSEAIARAKRLLGNQSEREAQKRLFLEFGIRLLKEIGITGSLLDEESEKDIDVTEEVEAAAKIYNYLLKTRVGTGENATFLASGFRGNPVAKSEGSILGVFIDPPSTVYLSSTTCVAILGMKIPNAVRHNIGTRVTLPKSFGTQAGSKVLKVEIGEVPPVPPGEPWIDPRPPDPVDEDGFKLDYGDDPDDMTPPDGVDVSHDADVVDSTDDFKVPTEDEFLHVALPPDDEGDDDDGRDRFDGHPRRG